ncbi:ABC transporter ATP-binding protein [Spelaeicoccus albus]|uniref:Peptide/nickel transport system ATP-binding protein n=1 Tax=Spelaeicoccus albus TaxID=1280376 RepID=A0A7Z0D088_9MICO|nr:ABC transporter ATP-binding protein [Spelaeicoccus albus]NYI67059.1 peptide/nickel transport system ATP-binding protein [Spelaeicoccus albus]
MTEAIDSHDSDARVAHGEAMLTVRDLEVKFGGTHREVSVVRGVSFEIDRGETLGIVGESGSGKSVTATAIMGLHGANASISGSVKLDGKELLGLSDAGMSRLRGSKIAMIFQDPMTSLDPVQKIGVQVVEAVMLHRQLNRKEAEAETLRLLELVGIPDASRRISDYPHQFSGGMRQRVVIAIAMANNPDLIIADEPTTALDVTVQAQVLDALKRAQEHTNAALILVTHDLGVVAGRADRIMVMYAGKAVETGEVDEIFYRSRMPYTRGLLAALPRIDVRDRRLTPIPGSPPQPATLTGSACPFATRCDFAANLCLESEPELIDVNDAQHKAACHFALDQDVLPAYESRPREEPPQARDATRPEEADESEPIFRVSNLTKDFRVRRDSAVVRAVNDVSFAIRAGETLGLVGESGCGKSTISRAVVRLDDPTSGTVHLGGQELTAMSRSVLRPHRRRVQMVFQDPHSSLDPRMSIEQVLAEPLRLAGYSRSERRARIIALLEDVGLPAESASRYPHEFSGGQRQRIGIARALATDPELLVLDEPVSALDVSVQAGVINLLSDLVDAKQLGYLFIAHDLSVVAHISTNIAVMYLGRIVEYGASGDIFDSPRHPYTKALISAIPIPDPVRERAREKVVLRGEVPSPLDPPSGCPFRTRCLIYNQVLTADQQTHCATEVPKLEPDVGSHEVACHYPDLYSQTTTEEVEG